MFGRLGGREAGDLAHRRFVLGDTSPGQLDPMLPIECQRDIAGALNPSLLTYREFEGCGHGVVPDVPHEAMSLLREFILTQTRL